MTDPCRGYNGARVCGREGARIWSNAGSYVLIRLRGDCVDDRVASLCSCRVGSGRVGSGPPPAGDGQAASVYRRHTLIVGLSFVFLIVPSTFIS